MAFWGFGKPNVGKLKARRDVQGLIVALQKSKDNAVQTEVCDALIEIGPEAVPLLSWAVIESKSEVRLAALLTLERISNEQAITSIQEALKNSSFQVRKEAARILGKHGNPDALEKLLAVPATEMRSFTQIGCQPDRFSREVINAAAAAVVKIGTRHFEQLLALLQHPDIAPFAARALGWIGNRQAVPYLVEALEDSNEFLFEAVAEALAELKDPVSVDPLISSLSRGRPMAMAANKALQRITGHRYLG
jgi:HEAT repeat protein